MAVANQIFNVKLLWINQSGTVNMGDAVNVRPSSNLKDLGGGNPIGDFAANVCGGTNILFDLDVIDQA
ncbi:hypothetical protein GCM10011571_15390 [Marinithermofilum abyssi]|uniref:Spore germination protein n=1 Tax=Marinithermofilum abyssi TaxID=1571185 RepID=A0A8J2VG87_9BACL|nr:spore germination protein [Marinithermofilum abyssi]GGE14812.1 hypothetical protein GCM10011571_15390 [Marinithermofilum abyssi]